MATGLGLVGYESSDDEANSEPELISKKHSNRDDPNSPSKCPTREHPQATKAESTPVASGEFPREPTIGATRESSVQMPSVALENALTWDPGAQPPLSTSQDELIPGPSLGPAGPPVVEAFDELTANPQSPYSEARSQIRNLTMPPVPNFNIPLSPPGSPPPQITKKFEQFLELKQKGKHFNENLAKSSALRNPTLLQKLMGFAGISEEDQYASTLPSEAAVPSIFPEWAYGDQLDKTQKATTKKMEEEATKKQRESLTFLKASESGASSRSTTPGTAPRAGHSAAERVMAELDRNGPQSQAKVTDRKGGRASGLANRFDQRSRSPRR